MKNNKIMDKYSIYCTPEQTKKALDLGAPIVKVDTKDKRLRYYDNLFYPIIADYPFAIPTSEQMINWLEEQGIHFEVSYMQYFHVEGGRDIFDKLTYEYHISIIGKIRQLSKESDFSSRKEATLAAIDAALDYLNKNKKNG